MKNVYTAVYKCKRVEPVGLHGYHNVVLGLGGVEYGNYVSTDIVVKGTCAQFEVGKEYIINISTD